jgi:hypothetical protein
MLSMLSGVGSDTLGFDYHRQLDDSEYSETFSYPISSYLNKNSFKGNFCGEMSLLNALDIMSMRSFRNVSGLTVSDLVNKYFVDPNTNTILATYKNNNFAFDNPSGVMNPTAMYYILKSVGEDSTLWSTEIIRGNAESKYQEPAKVADLDSIIEKANEKVFSKGGIIIADATVNTSWKETYPLSFVPKDSKYFYGHFFVILGMYKNSRGEYIMKIVDSLGSDKNGYYGDVNILAYTLSPNFDSKYTGLTNLFGLIPSGE